MILSKYKWLGYVKRSTETVNDLDNLEMVQSPISKWNKLIRISLFK